MNRIHKIIACLVAATLLLYTEGCAHVSENNATSPCTEQSCRVEGYVIGPGDVLHISVWKNTALDRVVTVRPDGKISFPLLNDVQSAGLTPMQLQSSILGKLRQYIDAPDVSVVVQEIHSFAVSVLGQVRKPGHYELKTDETVLDVLAQAGGLTEFANESKILILRDNGTTRQRIPFNYKDAIAQDGDHGNFYLRPGDIVVVP